jgi:CBS domain-containing protein
MSINPAPALSADRPRARRELGPDFSSTPEEQGILVLRQAIADARNFDQLAEVAAGLRTTAVSLLDGHAAPSQTSAIISTLADWLTRRSIERSISELGPPPCAVSWFALGSHGRQEPVPGSDVDSALTWADDEGDEGVKTYMRALGRRVCAGLARCGLRADKRGATAGQDLFVRPVSAWRRLIRESIREPRKDKGMIVISLFMDGRVLHDGGGASELLHELEAAHGRRGLLRLMLNLALANKPPVGRLRDFVVERSGEHRGRIDIKQGGLLPVTSIARYASLAAGAIASGTTPERLSAAERAGTLDSKFARTLSEAFGLFQGLRLEHQVDQIQQGIEPDDYLDPEAMSPAGRRDLRDAFREVRAVQKRLGRQLSGEVAFCT